MLAIEGRVWQIEARFHACKGLVEESDARRDPQERSINIKDLAVSSNWTRERIESEKERFAVEKSVDNRNNKSILGRFQSYEINNAKQR